MTFRPIYITAITFLLTMLLWQSSPAQDTRPQQGAPNNSEVQDNDRHEILESDRWRRAYRSFNEWLSVQQIYTEEQIAAVKEDLASRVAGMSAPELKEFLEDMEKRLDVLKSPEAEDARMWLAQFFAVARDPEAQLGRNRPDVLNMTASQIRHEIQWLQEHREARLRSQEAFEWSRAHRREHARGVREARRQSQQSAAASRSRAARTKFRSQYAPRPQDRPGFTDLRPQPMGTPVWLSPWGAPIYW